MDSWSGALSRRIDPGKHAIVLGAGGCLLAVFLGVVGATRYGVFVGSALIGLALFGIAIATYAKDPVLALIGLWLFEVFNAPLSAVFGYNSSTGQAVRQGDEILVLMFIALTIRRTLRTNISLPPLRFIIPGAGVALFGLLGAIVHGVSINTSMVGALLGLKFWIMVVITLLLPWQQSDSDRVYTVITRLGLIVGTLGLADYFTNGAVSRTLHTSNYFIQAGGYRSEAVHSIFPSPGEYSLFMSLLFGITFARFTTKYSRHDLLLALFFAASALLSLRLKGVLSLAAVITIVGFVQGLANSRHAIAALLIGAILLGGAYSLEGSVIAKQFSTYTSSETSARSRLYSTGEQIASDDFPLGVGFGRFASYPSRIYYSSVYYQYKLSRVFGLSPTYPHFIDDTTWPSVIGETGYGGFAFYVIGLVVLVLAIVRKLRIARMDMRWVPLAALCAIAVLLVDSLGEASLFSWLDTTTVALILGPALVATPLRETSSPPRPAGKQ